MTTRAAHLSQLRAAHLSQLVARLNQVNHVKATRFFIIMDDSRECYRVWQASSPGDVFDVIPYQGSELLVAWWRKHPDMFIFGDPEDHTD